MSRARSNTDVLIETYVQTVYNDLLEYRVKRGQGFKESLYQTDASAIRDRDEGEWLRNDSLEDDRRGLNEDTLDEAIKTSRNLVLTNTHGRGIVRSYVKWVIGRGVKYIPVEMSEAAKNSAIKLWRWWCKENQWAQRERQIVWRTLRDGETFAQFYDNSKNLAVRFKNPLNCKDLKNRVSFGIRTKPGDVETPTLYYFIDGNGKQEIVQGRDIIHVKAGVDMDVKRGLPILYTSQFRLRRYDTWLEDRIILNKVRSAIALIRIHKQGPSAVQSFADANKTDTKTDRGTGESVRVKKLRGGTMIDATSGIDYKFLAPNVDAKDVAQDGRTILLSVSASHGLAEYIITGDTSKANYASTLVAEAMSVKEFEYWQDFFSEGYEDTYWRVMRWGVKRKKAHSGILKGRVELTFPRVLSRKPKDEATADEILSNSQVLSPQTMAGRAGLDFEKEQRLIQEFIETHEGPLSQRTSQDGSPGEDENARNIEAMENKDRTEEDE